MPAFIDENQQFIDPDTSAPIVNGKVFFGEKGSNPTAAPIIVFTDRELTTPINQPILTDASGRTTVKIWIPGLYSFKVLDQNNVQKLIDTDAGTSEAIGTAVLTNIIGANNITANADPVITTLIDGTQFTFTAVAVNTANMKLNIDGLGLKSILFNFNEEMAPGFIRQNQIVNITYNLIRDNFVWNNEGRGISILTSVGGTANAITAVGGPSITTNYVNGQLYSFIANAENTGAVTLTIGALPTVSIKNQGAELSAARLLAGITYIVSFDLSGNTFELVNSNDLSAPGPIGDVTPNTIEGTDITASGEFDGALGTTNPKTVGFTTLQGNGGQAITQFDNDSALTENSSTRGSTQQAIRGFALQKNVNAVGQGDIANSAVGRLELKTTTVSLAGSIGPGLRISILLTGGGYAFFPMIHSSIAETSVGANITDGASADAPRFSLKNNSGTTTNFDVDHRFIQA